MQTRFAALALALALGLVACSGKKEANEMAKHATEMCACKTVECADAIFAKIEVFTKANEGKQVEATAADNYNRELDRTQKCYDKLQAAAPKPE